MPELNVNLVFHLKIRNITMRKLTCEQLLTVVFNYLMIKIPTCVSHLTFHGNQIVEYENSDMVVIKYLNVHLIFKCSMLLRG